MSNIKKKLIPIILLFLVLPIISAQFYILDSDTTLTATGSNSSLTFSVRVTTNQITVESDSITLDYVAYKIGDYEYYCENFVYSVANSTLDSKDFGCPIFAGQGTTGSSGSDSTSYTSIILDGIQSETTQPTQPEDQTFSEKVSDKIDEIVEAGKDLVDVVTNKKEVKDTNIGEFIKNNIFGILLIGLFILFISTRLIERKFHR